MSRKSRSSTRTGTCIAGLFLPVLSCAFFITVSSPISAQDRNPFDPVFAPATGEELNEINLPLRRRVNETFSDGRMPSFAPPSPTTIVSKTPSSEPDEANHGVSHSEESTSLPAPRPDTSLPRHDATTASREGLLASLLRLFGFGGDNKSTSVADHEPDAVEKPVASDSPPAPEQSIKQEIESPSEAATGQQNIQKTATRTTDVLPAPVKAADPKPALSSSSSTSSVNSQGYFQQLTTWFANNTEQVGVPDEARRKAKSVSIDLPPPLATAQLNVSSVEAPSGITVTIDAPQPETAPSRQVSSLPSVEASPPVGSSPELESAPAREPKAELPTIKRKETETNFVDVVSSFFSGERVTRAPPSDTETHRQRRTEQDSSPPEIASTPTAIQRTIIADRKITATAVEQKSEPTPLVDAAIAEAQRSKTAPAENTAFAVDIAVPVTDGVRIVEKKLVLGIEGNLGRAMPFGDDPGEHCIRRLSGKTWICLESLGWPAVIADAFMSRGVPEGRTKAIVRYDSEEATQYRVSFPARSFDRIRFHFEYLLGPPNDTPEVWVPLFAEPKRRNRVIRWVAETTGGQPPAVLEMREIDDIRWMEAPDTINGVVRLYRDGAKPIFSMVMTADLRLIEVRRIGDKKDTVKFTTEP